MPSFHNNNDIYINKSHISRIKQNTVGIVEILLVNDVTIYTNESNLDLLADKFYNDVSLWWVIATANALGKGSLYIPENTRLRIPSVTKIQDVIESLNNSR